MYDASRARAEPDGPTPGARPDAALPPVRSPLPALAAADAATRRRALATLQASAGNQAVARAVKLMREPAAPAPTSTSAPTGSDVLAMIESAWPDTPWQQGRLVLDILRVVPGLGIGTGFVSDLMAGWDDWNAVPNGDPVVVGLTEGLIVCRTGINTFHDVVTGLLQIGQLAQIALSALTAGAPEGGVTAPAAVPAALATLAAFAANKPLEVLVGGTSGVTLALDTLITLDAATWAVLGPVSTREQWENLALGYFANVLGELADLPVILTGLVSFDELPSATALQAITALKGLIRPERMLKAALQSALKAYWNVRGGDMLQRGRDGLEDGGDGGLEPTDPVVQPGSEVGFGSITQGYTRGEKVLGEAASSYAQLRDTSAAIAKDGTSAAVEQLNAQLPEYARDPEQRLATVEQVSGALDAGLKELDVFGGELDELVATLDGLTLEGVPEALLGQVQPLVDRVKETVLVPLLALQSGLQQVRTGLSAIAPAAQQTAALYRQGLEQLDAAQSGLALLGGAGDAAATLLAAEDVPVEAALADWRELRPEIDAAT